MRVTQDQMQDLIFVVAQVLGIYTFHASSQRDGNFSSSSCCMNDEITHLCTELILTNVVMML